MKKKPYACPYCNAPLTGKETACPACRNALTPVIKTDPKKKKKVLIMLAIILGAALLITLFLLWWFKAWIFAPHLNTAVFDTTFLPANADDWKEPSEEQMKAVSDYVNKIMVQSERRLTPEDRKGAKSLKLIFETLTSKDPDIQKLYRDLGVDLKTEEGAALKNVIEGVYTSLTTTSNPEGGESEAAEETGEGAPSESEDAGESEETLPPSYVHSSRVKLVSDRAKTVTCPSCGEVNPAENEYCRKCGTALYPSPHTVGVGEYMPETSGGAGMTPEQQESLLISNVANTLLIANRSGISYYMAALACAEDPYNVSAIVTLVTQLRMRDLLDEALCICIHGLEMDPTREELYIHAGQICISKDDPDGALRYFNRSLAITGFSGPVYQGMMLAYLQKKDYNNAFRSMVEGARDGYSSSIRVVYDILKLRPDYYDIAATYFEKHSVRSLMDFSMNRSGFNPAVELKGKVVDIAASKVPSRPEDWVASAKEMIKQGQDYLAGMISFYSEDIKDIATAYDILMNSDSIMELATNFIKAYGDKFSKEKLTEAERMISYEQEIFWLDILDDYREWKVKTLREEMDKELEKCGFNEIMGLIGKYFEEAKERLEVMDTAPDIEALIYALQFLMERVIGNHSIAFTSEQSGIIVSKIKNALQVNANVRNDGYREIAEMLGDYYMYSNAILGLVADKELYFQYRREITLNVAQDQGLCVAENAMFAVFVPILAEPYLMIGSQAQDGFTEGAHTGSNPVFPKFVVSSRPATPSADMYGDIVIPDISKVTQDVLGLANLSEPVDDGKEHFPAFREVWEINWKETHPGEPIPAAPNFNDPNVRSKFWEGLTPEQRVKYSAIMANPDVVNATVSLNMFCGRGQSVTTFQTEDIGLAGNLGLSFNSHGASASVDATGQVTGAANFGIGKVSMDRNGNMSITLKDDALGLSGGVKRTGRDLTTFMGMGRSAGLFANTNHLAVEGAGADAKLQVYSTYNLASGKFTSGGFKYGASAVLAGLLGIGYETNINVVQGQSTTNIFLILAGKKLSAKLKDDFNYEDDRTTDNVPGLQEFHR